MTVAIELNNTNCKEYTCDELANLLNVNSLDSLTNKLKEIYKFYKKVEYKSQEFWVLCQNESDVKKQILDIYGKDALLDAIMPNTKGAFKTKKSKGNYLD